MTMNLDRFAEIVQSYGTAPARWPGDECQAAKQLVETSAEARAILASEEPLDDLLMLVEGQLIGQESMNSVRLAVRDEISKPGPWIPRLVDWITPDVGDLSHTLWRPTLAAAILLIAGIFIGVLVPAGTDADLSTEQELYLLALSDAGEEEWLYEE